MKDETDPLTAARDRMVREQIKRRGVCDVRVLKAMRRVPRHDFIPRRLQGEAYADYPLPIGQGQTISQPYIVAAMTEALEIDRTSRVLEIGTGSGYQCAVLAEIAAEVHSVECRASLFEEVRPLFATPNYAHVFLHLANGAAGWADAAPYDAIISTCATPKIPVAWQEQLVEGGRLVAPVGRIGAQSLVRIRRVESTFPEEHLMGVRFVLMKD